MACSFIDVIKSVMSVSLLLNKKLLAHGIEGNVIAVFRNYTDEVLPMFCFHSIQYCELLTLRSCMFSSVS
jgi:hypothetical protein